MLAESTQNLARGKYEDIILRASRRAEIALASDNLYHLATLTLYRTILEAIEYLASRLMNTDPPKTFSGNFNSFEEAIQKIISLSEYSHSSETNLGNQILTTTYPGPQHMASLILNLSGTLESASIYNITPPEDVDDQKWGEWLRHRAKTKPILWPNHKEAIDKGFHLAGNSCVLVLPTGAGKTTLSEVKIAGILAQGKHVIFLAPTNALVEQLQHDLKEAFPEALIGESVSSELDLIHTIENELQPIEVMTPEKCLALLNFVPHAFQNVGLLVFDESHMISPSSGSLRRAIDSMLCILSFNKIVSHADFLFLSAMISNEIEFSAWIENLTGRNCIPINLVWKTSRQARGVVVYSREEVSSKVKNSSKSELEVKPYALFGLLHNWHSGTTEDTGILQLVQDDVSLKMNINKYGRTNVVPNANEVAADLAVAAARSQLKTIVFVNDTRWTISTAKKINKKLNIKLEFNEGESRLWNSICTELGDSKHSLIKGFSSAFPHNANLIPYERRLAESLFKRDNGIPIIVATTTLSQGMNLPAQMAILAGDQRFDVTGPQPLEAHELLNAAGRAGRAGYLANGIVLLIPGHVAYIQNGIPIEDTKRALNSIFPNQEQCVRITDPLENVLDQVQYGANITPEVLYTFHRLLGKASDTDEELDAEVTLSRSLAAFQARTGEERQIFERKTNIFKTKLLEYRGQETSDWLVKLTTQSGTSPDVINRLYRYITENITQLPITISDWIYWLLDWVKWNRDVAEFCLGYDLSKAIKAVGKKRSDSINDDDFDLLYNGLTAWIYGQPLSAINQALGGDNNKDITCSRARVLVTDIAPRSLSYFFNLIAQITSIACNELGVLYQRPAILDCISTSIRKGYDSPEKLAYATLIKTPYLSRVRSPSTFLCTIR